MPANRPVECPACGHEHLRRRSQVEPATESFWSKRADEWICGLCRYEWEVIGTGRSSARESS